MVSVFRGAGIPTVLISNDDGLALRTTYLYDRGYYILITPDFSQNLLSYLLPFAVVIGICLIIMISFMVVKCVRDRRKSRRHRLSSKHLKKIPTTKFKKGDHYDTCAICLDEYVDGEKLRVLPCGHGQSFRLFLGSCANNCVPFRSLSHEVHRSMAHEEQAGLSCL